MWECKPPFVGLSRRTAVAFEPAVADGSCEGLGTRVRGEESMFVKGVVLTVRWEGFDSAFW